MGNLFVPWHLWIILLLIVPVLGIHFLPAILSGVRHTRNFGWILVVNIFLAWTVIGWIIALVWACLDQPSYLPPPGPYPPYPPYNS
jgi:hypothetical protein